MDDNRQYLEEQEAKEREFESLCKRCGAGGGVKDGDPCENLALEPDGLHYFCRIYADRLGLRRTVSGREFTCVPLRQILHKTWLGRPECAYVKALNGQTGE